MRMLLDKNMPTMLDQLLHQRKRQLFWDCLLTRQVSQVVTPPTEWIKISSWTDDEYCKHIQEYLDGKWNYKDWKNYRDRRLARKDLELVPGKFEPNPAPKDEPKVFVAPLARNKPDSKRYLFNQWAERARGLSTEARKQLNRQALHNRNILAEEGWVS